MAQYLQSFIEFLEKHHPDELLRIKREGRPRVQATAILWRPERKRRFPVVILVFHSDRDGDQEFGVWEDARGWL
jgi:3-polyprenyl-4-hydroxybenzoate decarboxylase